MEEPKHKKTTTLFVTYNAVRKQGFDNWQGIMLPCRYAYAEGTHKSQWSEDEAIIKYGHEYYFPKRLYQGVDMAKVDNVVVYVGELEGYYPEPTKGIGEAEPLLMQLAKDGKKITLATCTCRWPEGRKQRAANMAGAELLWTECKGETSLGDMVDEILKKGGPNQCKPDQEACITSMNLGFGVEMRDQLYERQRQREWEESRRQKKLPLVQL